MMVNGKNQQTSEATSSPSQPVAGNPEDLNKRAQNENPRANENLQDDEDDYQDPAHDIGSEITDGEDA